MIRVCRFLATLVLLFGKNSIISGTSVLFIPNNYSSRCLEELGVKNYYGYDSPELTYNSSCYTKCIYEKEGKLDSNGLFVPSQFSTEAFDALTECLNIVKTNDICKKVSLIDTCIMRRTDPYWKEYIQCEKFVTYDDGPDGISSNCYRRCQMIADGSLEHDGKVNFTSITIFEPNPNNTITHEEAVVKCKQIINDKDVCEHDLNMHSCVSYTLYHWSSKILENEFKCGKEHNVYPFFGVQNFNMPTRACYDRCILIKNGDLDEHDLKKSEFFKTLNMSETKLEEAFNECKLVMGETDKCTKDLYFYDCVSYIHYADPVYLKKQKECALETNTPLVAYRQKNVEQFCNTRCMMIKEGQLDKDGKIIKVDLKQFAVNDTIIDEAVKECNAQNKNRSCNEDINAYYCATTRINEIIYSMCDAEISKNGKEDKGGFCTGRCIMIHNGQLTQNGEVVVESFKHLDKDIAIIEKAIRICKGKMIDADECERVVEYYICVNTEIWNISMDSSNNVDVSEKAD